MAGPECTSSKHSQRPKILRQMDDQNYHQSIKNHQQLHTVRFCEFLSHFENEQRQQGEELDHHHSYQQHLQDDFRETYEQMTDTGYSLSDQLNRIMYTKNITSNYIPILNECSDLKQFHVNYYNRKFIIQYHDLLWVN